MTKDYMLVAFEDSVLVELDRAVVHWCCGSVVNLVDCPASIRETPDDW